MKKIILLISLIFTTSISFSQKVFSPTHKKYVGKIVFSKSVINYGKEIESKFITEFTHGDALNFRVFMEKPLMSILNDYRKGYANPDYSGYKWHFILDGEEISTSNQIGWSSKAMKTWTTWRGAMNDKNNPKHMGSAAYAKFINDAAIAGKMTKGKHTLEIKLFPENPLYRGDVSKLKPVATAKLIMYVKGDFKPECLPKAKMQNAGLEAQMLNVIKEKARMDGWKEIFKKVVIVSDTWEIERHPTFTSQIQRRIISAIITAQWPDGHCTYQGFSFSQEYIEGKYSRKLDYYSTGRQVKIPCSCLK